MIRRTASREPRTVAARGSPSGSSASSSFGAISGWNPATCRSLMAGGWFMSVLPAVSRVPGQPPQRRKAETFASALLALDGRPSVSAPRRRLHPEPAQSANTNGTWHWILQDQRTGGRGRGGGLGPAGERE